MDLTPTSTGDTYTKAHVDGTLPLKQHILNWISGDSNCKNSISTGQGLLTISTPNSNGTLSPAIVVNGPFYTNRKGQVRIYTKVVMLDDLDVSGAITKGGCQC